MEEVVVGGMDGPCSKQATRSILVKGLLVRCHDIEWDFGFVGGLGWGSRGGFVGEAGRCLGSARGLGRAGHFGGSAGRG